MVQSRSCIGSRAGIRLDQHPTRVLIVTAVRFIIRALRRRFEAESVDELHVKRGGIRVIPSWTTVASRYVIQHTQLLANDQLFPWRESAETLKFAR